MTGAFDRLLAFRPTGAPVVSLYLPLPRDGHEARLFTSRLTAMLDAIAERAERDSTDDSETGREAVELRRDDRLSVRADVARLRGLADRLREWEGGRGLAVFACDRAGMYEEVVLPRSVRDRWFVDATPYLRPMLAVLDELHRACVVVVDRGLARIYDLWLDRLEERDKLDGEPPRTRKAVGRLGLDDYRLRNRAETLARRHFRRTAEAAADIVRSTGAEILVVGGHEQTVAEFLPFLPRDVATKVAGKFVIDPSTLTPARVRERAQQVIDEYERREEARLVADALDRVGAGGLAAAGLEWCLLAVDEEAVQHLLVHDEVQVPGRVCDRCGWMGREGDPCPVCGAPTRVTPDVIDEMAVAVITAGGRVEHVYGDTPFHEHLVAAFLRFPVPRPEDASA